MPKLPQELQPERSLGAERDYFRFMQDALLHVGVVDKDKYDINDLHLRLQHLRRLHLWGRSLHHALVHTNSAAACLAEHQADPSGGSAYTFRVSLSLLMR